MTTVQTFLHYACIMMFVVSAFFHTIAAVKTFRSRFNKHIRRAMLGSSAFGAGLSVLFIFLQLEWVISGHNMVVGNIVSYGWLVFDYMLAIFLISTSMVLISMLEWQVSVTGRHERWYEKELPPAEEINWTNNKVDKTSNLDRMLK